MLNAVEAVQQFQEKLCRCIIVKVIAVFIKLCQKLNLFFMLFLNTDVSSHEIFNIKRGLDCRWEMPLDLHSWNMVLKFMH
jgi:hypothetical protein